MVEELGAKKLLETFADKSVSEEQAKLLFHEYSTDGKVLDRDDLTSFLIDLQSAFQSPPCIPHESVDNVLAELVLNVEATGKISWIEFKSFFVYLQSTPIKHLHDSIVSVFRNPNLSQNAVLVSFFLPENALKKVTKAESDKDGEEKNDQIETQLLPDLDTIREALLVEFCNEGENAQVFAVFHSCTSRIEALIVYEAEASVANAMKRHQTNIIENYKCTVIKYSSQRFPSLPVTTQRSKAAEVAAKGVLMSRDALSSAKSFNEQHKITENIRGGAQAVVGSARTVATNIDDTMHISETARNVTHTISEGAKSFNEQHHITERAAVTAKQVDETLKISENVGRAQEGLMSAAAAISSTRAFQSGVGFFSGLASTVSTVVTGFQQETMEIVSEQSPAQPNENPEEAMHQEAGSVNIEARGVQNEAVQQQDAPSAMNLADDAPAAAHPAQ